MVAQKSDPKLAIGKSREVYVDTSYGGVAFEYVMDHNQTVTESSKVLKRVLLAKTPTAWTKRGVKLYKGLWALDFLGRKHPEKVIQLLTRIISSRRIKEGDGKRRASQIV